MEEIFLDDEMTKIKWGNCRFVNDVRPIKVINYEAFP